MYSDAAFFASILSQTEPDNSLQRLNLGQSLL